MLSTVELYAAVRWWLVLALLGLAALPLTLRLLQPLPDRGYAFSKMIGLVIVGYVFWLLGSFGFLNNSVGGALFGIITLLALSGLAARRLATNADAGDCAQQDSMWHWLKEHWRYVLLVEIIFAVVFFAWVWVRSQNPAIVATEKPMEFAFLNASGRSPGIPPLDPWMSGFAISYYYFGYLMTSILARLSAVPEQIAFNLAIAWLAAGTAIGAFGLAYNLIAADKDALRRRAAILGLVAAIALPFAGNLEIVLETLYANEIGSDAFWEWLDIRDLNDPESRGDVPRYETSSWWWWRSSRVIHEYHLSGRAEEGLEPIAEFPAFSLILGDLHAHVLALPFAFLSLAVAMTWWQKRTRPHLDFRDWFSPGGLRRQLHAIEMEQGALLVFTAILLGALSFLNTWDVLIHLFVVVGAFALAQWRSAGRWNPSLFRQAVTVGVVLAVMAILFYLPFYLGLRSQAAPPYLLPFIMRPTRLAHFLVIFGLPLIAILFLIVILLRWMVQHRDLGGTGRPLRTAVLLTVGLLLLLLLMMFILGWLVSGSPEGMPVVHALLDELELDVAEFDVSAGSAGQVIWAFSAISKLLPKVVEARLVQPFMILLLAGVLVATIYLLLRLLQPHSETLDADWPSIESQSLPFVLMLIGTGTLLVLGPEFVYLRDNFGQRINTIFKFYYQAWILFGIAALYGLAFLLRRFRLGGWLATSIYLLLLAGSLLFPYYAVRSRTEEYRGSVNDERRLPATLDGLAYLQNSNPDEYEAILWLRENVDGVPVLLEAVGGQYSQYGRISAATGLPTLLGWSGHEYQWRGDTPEPAERERVVKSIYSPLDWASTEALLDQYDVRYVYFGQLERNTYDPSSEVKFEQNMDAAFRNNGVTIYKRPAESAN